MITKNDSTFDVRRFTASVKDMSDHIGVDTSTIRRYVAQGILSAVRIGKTTLRIDPDSLQVTPVGAAA
ncbi:helix-turn-helix domain-containing protein [Rathayibacter soli]|uniref:helix-turn-helix domain-containing protein n=1 Tax=Rathayibacter soli TaxID=3144168 RepID=UPI0027E52541|nr:helix-turn-helix domain-containing protein [Glaciibacter superstes]